MRQSDASSSQTYRMGVDIAVARLPCHVPLVPRHASPVSGKQGDLYLRTPRPGPSGKIGSFEPLQAPSGFAVLTSGALWELGPVCQTDEPASVNED